MTATPQTAPLMKARARAQADKAAQKDGEHLDELVDGHDDGRAERKQLDAQCKDEHRRQRTDGRDADALADLRRGAADLSSHHKKYLRTRSVLSLCGGCLFYTAAHSLVLLCRASFSPSKGSAGCCSADASSCFSAGALRPSARVRAWRPSGRSPACRTSCSCSCPSLSPVRRTKVPSSSSTSTTSPTMPPMVLTLLPGRTALMVSLKVLLLFALRDERPDERTRRAVRR